MTFNEAEQTLLERYLDGLLTPAERAEFERTLASDAELRGEVELQRRCDRSLQMLAASQLDVAAIVREAQRQALPATRGPSRVIRLVRYSLAAAVLLGVSLFGAWEIVSWMDSSEQQQRYALDSPGPRRTLRQAYSRREQSNFSVDWKCKTDREFADTFRKRFGQALLVTATLPADVKVNGLCYEFVCTPRTTMLVARVEGKGVVVFVDKRDRCADVDMTLPPELHSFEREIGKLRLTEVTPFDRPRVLELFFDPDQR